MIKYSMTLVCLQGKPFNITVIQVYAPTTNDKEAKVEWFYEDLQDFLELTPKKCHFHHRELECKSRKSRDTWSNRQVWNTKWSKAKANRILSRKHTSQQTPFSNNTRDDYTHGHHHITNTEIRLMIFSAAEDGKALYSHQRQDQELTVAQIMSSLLKSSGLHWRK